MEAGAPTTAAIEGASSLVGRNLDVTVLDILWSPTGGGPKSLSIQVASWLRRSPGGPLEPLPVDGAPWMEVGHDYLVAVSRFPTGMSTTTADSIFEVHDGTLLTSARTGIAHKLNGLSMDQMQQQLAAARPDPVAESHRDLAPVQRYDLVTRGRANGS